MLTLQHEASAQQLACHQRLQLAHACSVLTPMLQLSFRRRDQRLQLVHVAAQARSACLRHSTKLQLSSWRRHQRLQLAHACSVHIPMLQLSSRRDTSASSLSMSRRRRAAHAYATARSFSSADSDVTSASSLATHDQCTFQCFS